MSADLAFAGIARQAELVRAGQVSSRELVELYLERIGRLDSTINAFRVVMGERALAEADQADARVKAGEERPLLGVPVAIKDGYDVVGEMTAMGGAAFDRVAADDAEVVKRLRGAGAVIVGKTNLPELAMFGYTESAAWGVTRNPWNPERITGGSSGGSAAAVAAGLVGVAQASDGAGSIRIPAACCGLFGLKPQRGRVSLMPDAEHWLGLSVIGCVSRSVADTALFLDVTAGPAKGDADTPPPPDAPYLKAAASPPEKLRVVTSLRAPIPVGPEPALAAAVSETAELLRGLGHEVSEGDPDWGAIGNPFAPRYLRAIHDDAKRAPAPDRLERRTRGVARLGSLFTPGIVRRAREREAEHAARINAIFDRHDVLITPVMAKLPAEVLRWEGKGTLRTLLEMAMRYPYTGGWNMLGNPAASVPAGFTDDGLPLSVQLIGRPNEESTLISLAAQIEAERPWAERRPPLS